MKVVFRVWLTALIIQPILFCFPMPWAALIIIPFELIGSLPGLLVFAIVVQILLKVKMPTALKWFFLLLTAAGTALLCSYWIAIVVDDAGTIQGDNMMLVLPAPLAALIAVVLHANAVNKMFISSTFIIPKDV
jgi:hypothetical protein